MAENNSKDIILGKIKEALATPVPLPFPGLENQPIGEVYPAREEDPAIVFAEEFTRVGGKFIFCESVEKLPATLRQLLADENLEKIYFKEDFVGQLLGDVKSFNSLKDCDVAITGCECLVARTGSMVLSSSNPGGRATSVYAPIHICIAFTPQLVYDISDAIQLLKSKFGSEIPSSISFATGPSRTADIEKTLVTGVHGPKQAFCILVETN